MACVALTLCAAPGASIARAQTSTGGRTPATRAQDLALEQAILAAEDARVEDNAALAPVRQGLKGGPRLQVLAVRALGRLERAALVPEITPLLDSPVVAVRVEAVNALGQAVVRGEAGPASGALTARARVETEARVLAAIARTLGRLPYQREPEIRDAERTILQIAQAADRTGRRASTPAIDASGGIESAAAARNRVTALSEPMPIDDETTILAGVAHGLDALARRAVKLGMLSADTRTRLRRLARHGLAAGDANDRSDAASAQPDHATPPAARTSPSSAVADARRANITTGDRKADAIDAAARVRRLAVAALVTTRESNVPLLRDVLRDPDEQVRRLGVVWLGASEDVPRRDDALRQAFADASPMVRYEALRTYARVRQTAAVATPVPPAAQTAAASASAPTASAQAAPASTPAGSAADTSECALEMAALDDVNVHVAVLAIDVLGRCGEPHAATDRLTPLVSAFFEVPRTARAPQDWHRPAHALVALARLAPDRASGWLARASAHEVWQVRMYAARAAGLLKDRATLDTLAVDGEDNVCQAAIEALQALVGHEADAQYLAALDRNDPQLLRTAARALVGTALRTEAVDRLLKTFVRISAGRRETSRDVRLALLDTLDTLGREAAPADRAGFSAAAVARETKGRQAAGADGSFTTSVAAQAAAGTAAGAPLERGAVDVLRPYLADFDPLVARRIAALLTAWTGQSQVAAPVRLPLTRVPSPREIERLGRTRAVLRMARGGTITLALRADAAPTNVARFVRLARAGYFNGLTFHRVEPNFVLQGGSPGANEYAGDGPFTRDELDLTSNLRGTVGLSTRGRDTGDGQFFVNLVDNPRLDHNYTVFAEIVDGLSVADEVLEGDVIARVELHERP